MRAEKPMVWFLYGQGRDPDQIRRQIPEFLDGRDYDTEWRTTSDGKVTKVRKHTWLGVQSDSGPTDLGLEGPALLFFPKWSDIGESSGSSLDHVDLLALIYEATDPEFGIGMIQGEYESLGVETPVPLGDGPRTERKFERPTWLMLFTPSMVAAYGREWLLDLPAERIEELDDGALLIVATQKPDGDESPEEFGERYFRPMKRLEEAFDVENYIY